MPSSTQSGRIQKRCRPTRQSKVLKPSEIISALSKQRRRSSQHQDAELPGKSGRHPKVPFDLLELPEEILLKIMKNLSPSELQLIRSTCSKLLRVSRTECFAQTIRTMPFTADLKRLLQKDMLCSSCWWSRNVRPTLRQLRIDWLSHERHSLWCSGCRLYHPRLLFSKAQRQAVNATRICIGREGRVRLCLHHTISWDDIEATLGVITSKPTTSSPFHTTEIKREMRCGGDGLVATMDVKKPSRLGPAVNISITRTNRFSAVAHSEEVISMDELIESNVRAEYAEVEDSLCSHLGVHHFTAHEEGRMASCPTSRCNTQVSCKAKKDAELGQSPGMVMTVQRSLSFTQPYDHEWVYALDPESFGMMNDNETDGITWCSDTTCRLHERQGLRKMIL